MKIIGIDPGNKISGICMLDDNKIAAAYNEPNETVFTTIQRLADGSEVEVVIEDISPYAMRISLQVIATCKFIGELEWRLRQCNLVTGIHLIARNSVKKWIFDTCGNVVVPRIDKKMFAADRRKVSKGEKGLRNADGLMRLASFHYVDDRSIIAALKELYQIPTPKAYKSNIYGLKDHSWQALAAAAYWQKLVLR